MAEYEEKELARLIDAGEISPEEVAEIEREDKRRNEIRKEESGDYDGECDSDCWHCGGDACPIQR
jgi:hypothetical protein